MDFLLCLPDEIVSCICDYVNPGNVVALARTCKRVHACAEKTLSKCAEIYGRLHLLHDRHPLTLLNTLREIVADPSRAWFIRDMELWELRESFSDWRTPIFTVANPYELDDANRKNWLEKHDNFDYLGDANREPLYPRDELNQYSSLLVNVLRIPLSEAEQWVDQLVIGCDEPLRVLLIALLPKLQRLLFVQYATEATYSASRHPLKLLSSSITRVFQTIPPGVQWPCYSRLEVVHVGARTDLRQPHDLYYTSTEEVAPLFLLPAIRQLQLNFVGYVMLRGETAYEFEWANGSSTCTDLTFNGGHVAPSTMISFILACKSLKRFRLLRSAGSARVVTALLQNSAKTLTEFLCHDRVGSSTDDKGRGWTLGTELRTGSKCNSGEKPHFETLRKLDIKVGDLIGKRNESVHRSFFPLSEVLGKSTRTVEAIRIRKLPPLQGTRGMQDLISTLSDFVSLKKLDNISQTALEPDSLRSMCLSELEDWNDNFFILEQLLKRLRRVCQERGIYLHENEKPGSELRCIVCREGIRYSRDELHTRPVIPPNPIEEEMQEQHEDHDDEVRPPEIPTSGGSSR